MSRTLYLECYSGISCRKPLPSSEMGIGAGKRTYDRPSLLRAMLIQEVLSEIGSVFGK